jgi:DNA-binding HxlR family transcriptional regulator
LCNFYKVAILRRISFNEFACSIARTLDTVGERWTMLVLRDLFLGLTRFDDIQRDLGIARNTLTDRLGALVAADIVEKRAYSQAPARHEYVLTEKGRDLQSVLLAIVAWGDRWESGEAGPPLRLRHEVCAGYTTPTVGCSLCGEPLHPGTLTAEAGPGGRTARGTAVVTELLAAGPRWLGD